MTTLPHLLFASELLDALTLMPAAVQGSELSSGWGANEWAAIGAGVAAIGAVTGAIATCVLATTAWKARNEWDNNTKKQARYDVEKLFASDVLPVMVCIESQAKQALKIAHKFSSDEIKTFSPDRADYLASVRTIDSHFEFLYGNLREAHALLKAAKADLSSIPALGHYGALVTNLNFNLHSLQKTKTENLSLHILIWEQIIKKTKLFCDEYQIPSEVLGFVAVRHTDNQENQSKPPKES
ncbi:hypothetical protein B0I24_101260 [Aliidiomarina maris]|nr:hypothetical protein B0I24_101260 [Aliidiomarina maris]